MSPKPLTIHRLVSGHQRIALDSNVLIYVLDGEGDRAEVAARLVDAIAEGNVQGVIATIGLSEILVGPARAGDGAMFERTGATVRDLGFRIVTLDAEIATDAAWIRGRTGSTLPDAIHLASARASGATAFVTNDRRIRPIPHLDVVYLDELVA